MIVTAGKGCCWRRGDPGTLLHTPQHPGWPRAEPADGQERGLGSWVAPRPELRDLHQLPCFFHSGSDRSPRRCWVRSGGVGLVGAASRDGRPRPTFLDSEDLGQEQSSYCPLGPDPTCSEQEIRTRSAETPGASVGPRVAGRSRGSGPGTDQGQRSEPRPHQPALLQPGCRGTGGKGPAQGRTRGRGARPAPTRLLSCRPGAGVRGGGATAGLRLPPAAGKLPAGVAPLPEQALPTQTTSVAPAFLFSLQMVFFLTGIGRRT